MENKKARIHFLHVRWLVRASEEFGDDVQSYERLRFVSEDDGLPIYGFLDPASVVRAVHLLPAFAYEDDPAEISASGEYKYFYVNK